MTTPAPWPHDRAFSRTSFPSLFDLETWQRRTVGLIAALTLLRLFVSATVGLSDTEAYYFTWSKRLALSYYDHPPMVAWMARLTTSFSSSPFAIRLGAVVCSTMFLVLVALFTARLFSSRVAFIVVGLVAATPGFAFTSFLLNPEAPLAPLWVLFLIQLYVMEDRRESWRPIALGATLGVAFLAKYTAILFVPVGLLFLMTSPRSRPWFKRPSLYLGGLLALVLTTPVIFWNVHHGWPSLTLHLAERMTTPDSGWARNALRVLAGQFFMFHPLLMPGMLAAIPVLLLEARRDTRYRLLACASIPILAFFGVVMTRAKDAEPHWTMVGWLPLMIALGTLTTQVDKERLGRWYVRIVTITSLVIGSAYVLHARSTVLLDLVPATVYDPNTDPLNETVGWENLNASVRAADEELGPGLVLVSSHNVLCGHIEHATARDLFCASQRRTAYDFMARRDPSTHSTALYIDTDRYAVDPSQALNRHRCERRDTIDIVRGTHVVNRFRLFTCRPIESSPPSLLGVRRDAP